MKIKISKSFILYGSAWPIGVHDVPDADAREFVRLGLAEFEKETPAPTVRQPRKRAAEIIEPEPAATVAEKDEGE